MPTDEQAFKEWFRRQWRRRGHWIESYEPRRGSGMGIPDIQVLLPSESLGLSVLLPIELKIGKITRNRLFPREIRGSQIVWHRDFRRAGGKAMVLVGIPAAEGYQMFFASGPLLDDLSGWRSGYAIPEEFAPFYWPDYY